ncbi:MAG: sensor histidine kinase [Proteobacteria bacterium]|nr:MAG: sensor histidine kinase [Pseudomonadota bacterium]
MASHFEEKVLFSRLRFLGLAYIAPSGLLFFARILHKWSWLRNKWVQALIFLPAFITTLMVLGVFDSELLVRDFAPFEYLGVAVLTFKGGTWFPFYFIWTHILTVLVLFLFLQTALSSQANRRDVLILSSGVIIGGAVDISCVYLFPSLRWLMLSAGTFSIIEISILYVAKKNDLFGLLTTERLARGKLITQLDFQKKLLTLVAHDLSGNIRQQANIAQVLKHRIQDNHHEILDSLANASTASDDLIINIMRWVKTQDQSFKPQVRSVEIHKLLRESMASLELSGNEPRADIIISGPVEPYNIKCDPEMMSSVFKNLLRNASKANVRSRNICLRIAEENNFVRFEIEDEGCGMPPDQVETLWDMQKKITDGTGYGVGLFLVRHFIELHAGSLQVTSRHNVGTKVQFTLPR